MMMMIVKKKMMMMVNVIMVMTMIQLVSGDDECEVGSQFFWFLFAFGDSKSITIVINTRFLKLIVLHLNKFYNIYN